MIQMCLTEVFQVAGQEEDAVVPNRKEENVFVLCSVVCSVVSIGSLINIMGRFLVIVWVE